MITPPTARIPPHAGLALGLLAVSSASILITYALRAGAPPLVIAAYRLVVASLLLAPFTIWRHPADIRRLSRREWLLAGLSGLFLAVHFGTWVSSLAYTSVASSAVFVNTAPLFVALFSAAFLGEKPSALTGGGMAVALLGGVAIGLGDACGPAGCPPLADLFRSTALLGDLLAMSGAAAFAVYLIFGRALRSTVPLLVYLSLTYGTAAVCLVAAALVGRLPLGGYVPQVYLWVVVLALVPQLVGHSAFNWALKYLPATYVSIIVLGEPIGSTLLAIGLLGQIPTPAVVFGGALILGGILLASVSLKNQG